MVVIVSASNEEIKSKFQKVQYGTREFLIISRQMHVGDPRFHPCGLGPTREIRCMGMSQLS